MLIVCEGVVCMHDTVLLPYGVSFVFEKQRMYLSDVLINGLSFQPVLLLWIN